MRPASRPSIHDQASPPAAGSVPKLTCRGETSNESSAVRAIDPESLVTLTTPAVGPTDAICWNIVVSVPPAPMRLRVLPVAVAPTTAVPPAGPAWNVTVPGPSGTRSVASNVVAAFPARNVSDPPIDEFRSTTPDGFPANESSTPVVPKLLGDGLPTVTCRATGSAESSTVTSTSPVLV